MFIWAATLYFPQHVMTIASRVWFYYAGDEDVMASAGVGGGGFGQGPAPGPTQVQGVQQGQEGQQPWMKEL